MVVDSPASAIKTALKQPETPILAAGSFYTASAVRQALLKNNEFMN
jgi:folylpolyglutamate synthase/dihydropteroate synthase